MAAYRCNKCNLQTDKDNTIVCASVGGDCPQGTHAFVPVEKKKVLKAGRLSKGTGIRVRADVKIEFKGQRTVVKDVLCDDGYSGTMCFPLCVAKQLSLRKRAKPHGRVQLGDGTEIDEFAYATGKDTAKLTIQFEDENGAKHTKTAVVPELFHDKKESIIGAKALMFMGVCVEAGSCLRLAQDHK